MEPSASVESRVHNHGVAIAVVPQQAVVGGAETWAVHALDVDVAYASAGKAVDKLFIAFHPCLILQSGVGFDGLDSNHTVGRVSVATHCKTRGAAGLAVEQGEIVTTCLDTAPVDGKDDVARSQTCLGGRQWATG